MFLKAIYLIIRLVNLEIFDFDKIFRQLPSAVCVSKSKPLNLKSLHL